ncbi:MAG: response regulator [Chitinispirillales bacterium]|jgi:signal transduction histidine kinase/response regulator RpfG family c-di-GMP phosphodiesterase|nr:response regulator [Chitinispirillales bacterium]
MVEKQKEIEKLKLEIKRLKRVIDVYERDIKREEKVEFAYQTLEEILDKQKIQALAYMELLLNCAKDMIVFMDKSGRIVYCSESFLKSARIKNRGLIYGRHCTEVFGRMLGADWVAKIRKEILNAMKENTPTVLCEIADVKIPGVVTNYSVSFNPMTNDFGNVVGAMLIFYDISELVKEKEKVLGASEAKSLFLANMSHEIRTPINAITGMTQIAMDSDNIERKNYCLKKIKESSEHLIGLINDVLDMSKIEAGKLKMSNSEFCFEEMLSGVVSIISFKILEKKQKFFLDIGKDVPFIIKSDKQRLEQVMINILSNAIKFTPEEGSIFLSVHKTKIYDDGVCQINISVKDTGIGISKNQQKKLFTPFQQANEGISKNFGGTGLGLTISKKIIETMGGEIWLESEENKGTKVSWTIKVFGSNEFPKEFAKSGTSISSLNVLFVDNDEKVLNCFGGMAEIHNLSHELAKDHVEALSLVQKKPEKYDFVFIDETMLIMNSAEMAKKMREFNGFHAKIVIVSSNVASNVSGKNFDPKINFAFLQKPLFWINVAAVMDSCLSETKTEASSKQLPQKHKYDSIFTGKKFLVVEDIEVNREIILQMLTVTGAKMDFAENGIEAIEKFGSESGGYDIILMDVQMPMMDGYKATKTIREMPFDCSQKIPIIAMTANVFREDVEKCIKSGMNSHVGKPIDRDILVEKISKYI